MVLARLEGRVGPSPLLKNSRATEAAAIVPARLKGSVGPSPLLINTLEQPRLSPAGFHWRFAVETDVFVLETGVGLGLFVLAGAPDGKGGGDDEVVLGSFSGFVASRGGGSTEFEQFFEERGSVGEFIGDLELTGFEHDLESCDEVVLSDAPFVVGPGFASGGGDDDGDEGGASGEMVEHFDDWLSHPGGVDDEGAVVVLLGDFEELGADLFDDIGVFGAEWDAVELADGVARVFEFLFESPIDRVAVFDERTRVFEQSEG